jgi:hypothetical protein
MRSKKRKESEIRSFEREIRIQLLIESIMGVVNPECAGAYFSERTERRSLSLTRVSCLRALVESFWVRL